MENWPSTTVTGLRFISIGPPMMVMPLAGRPMRMAVTSSALMSLAARSAITASIGAWL